MIMINLVENKRLHPAQNFVDWLQIRNTGNSPEGNRDMKEAEFKATKVNVLEIHKEIDLEIAIDEINYARDRIIDDINSGFGDKEWERDASYALKDIEHKGRLLEKKLANRKEKKKEEEKQNQEKKERMSEEVVLAHRFRNAAKVLLDSETFEKIRKLASLQQ